MQISTRNMLLPRLQFLKLLGKVGMVFLPLSFAANGKDAAALGSGAQTAQISVDAGKIIHPISPRIIGTNIEDLNFQLYGGLYSQLLHGENFEEHIDPADLLGLKGEARRRIYVREINGQPQLWAFRPARGEWQLEDTCKFLELPLDRKEPVTVEDLPPAKRAAFLEAALGDRQVSRHWRPIVSKEAVGRFKFERKDAYKGCPQSQRIGFLSGKGEVGIDNAGLNRIGIKLVAGQPYEGLLRIKTEGAREAYVSLRSADGKVLAEKPLALKGDAYERIEFTLTPSQSDDQGRFAVTLKEPGAIVLGYSFLQMGPWGRFKNLPVRKDLMHAVLDWGVKAMRYNGSQTNGCPDGLRYSWKQMVGPRDERRPYHGRFNPYASHGFTVFDFMDLCETAGFVGIPGLRIDEKTQDMSDLVDYALGGADTEWGRRRIADGHPKPYAFTHLQIGNEEVMNPGYVANFIRIGRAIWAKDKSIVLVVSQNLNATKEASTWALGPNGEQSAPLAEALKIIQFGAENGGTIWWDCHYHDTLNSAYNPNSQIQRMRNLRDTVQKLFPNYKEFKLSPMEENGNLAIMRRALAHAQNLHTFIRMGDLPAVGTANTFQADGQEIAWPQGEIYYNASRIWFQPPYYVDQMVSRNWGDNLVETASTPPEGSKLALDAVARASSDGRTLVLSVINAHPVSIQASLSIAGFRPGDQPQVTQLSGELNDMNTAKEPQKITPKQVPWAAGKTPQSYLFPPNSFTTIRWTGNQ